MNALITFWGACFVVETSVVDSKFKRINFNTGAAIDRGAVMLGRGVGDVLVKVLPNVSSGVIWVAKKVKPGQEARPKPHSA